MIDFRSITISSTIVKLAPGTLDEALAGMAGTKNLRPPSLAEQIQHIRQNAKFAEDKPNILFISDYIVDGKFIGVLIVFEKYLNATHYEVFKKNKFDNEPKFERILFLGSEALAQETKNFLPFLASVGFNLDENSIFAILDNSLKQDRIYEFFIRAGRVPQRIDELDFGLIMESKNMINTIEPHVNSSSRWIAASLLGTSDLSWIVALLNDFVSFFGNEFFFPGYGQIILPKNTEKFMNIINDAIDLFGAKVTLSHLLNILGARFKFDVSKKKTGYLNDDIFRAFSNSIDESNGIFSFDVFKNDLVERSKDFKALTDSGNDLTKKTGTLSFGSLKNLSEIFDYLQALDFSILSRSNPAVFVPTVSTTSETQQPAVVTASSTDGSVSTVSTIMQLERTT